MTSFPIREGEWVLRAMMREAGVDPDAPESVQVVWEVFKRFVEVPLQAFAGGSPGDWAGFVRLVEARPEMADLALAPPLAVAIEQEAV